MSGSTGPLFLTAEETESVLSWPDMIDALRHAYSVPLDHDASPPRVVARGGGSWLRALAAIPPSGRFMGTKVFGFSRSRNVSYLITLFDQESGEVAALIDANGVTAMRTAATSAVAVDRIATSGPKITGLLGSGAEARSHARAIASVRPFSELRVFSPTAANREAFAHDMCDELGVACRPVATPREAVEGAGLVIAAARSRDETPILEGSWLVPGSMVVSIGSTLPDQREIDSRTVEVCDLIVCDMPEEVIEETGDMLAAAADGIGFADKIVALNDVVRGLCDERIVGATLPMFKSVGAAVQDIAVAELAYERAMKRGLGTRLPIAFRDKRG